jgi:hypothetical protein
VHECENPHSFALVFLLFISTRYLRLISELLQQTLFIAMLHWAAVAYNLFACWLVCGLVVFYCLADGGSPPLQKAKRPAAKRRGEFLRLSAPNNNVEQLLPRPASTGECLSGFTRTNIPLLPLAAPSSWRGQRTRGFAKAKDITARSNNFIL